MTKEVHATDYKEDQIDIFEPLMRQVLFKGFLFSFYC